MLKYYKCMLVLDRRTGSRNMGGGDIFKVRATRMGFGAKWRMNAKADPSI